LLKYHFIDHVSVVNLVVDKLGWDKFQLIGHSMGQQICCAVAAGLGQRIKKLCLIEGFGPSSIPANLTASLLAKGLKDRRTLTMRAPRVYPSMQAAAEARVGANARIATIDLKSALVLSKRGMRKVGSRAVGEHRDTAVEFTQDPKMTGTPLIMFSDEQVLAIMGAIVAPTLCILAASGLPLPHNMLQRLDACPHVRG
jgi:pimeloyl-ACP methyl ester carboxylesterase